MLATNCRKTFFAIKKNSNSNLSLGDFQYITQISQKKSNDPKQLSNSHTRKEIFILEEFYYNLPQNEALKWISIEKIFLKKCFCFKYGIWNDLCCLLPKI